MKYVSHFIYLLVFVFYSCADNKKNTKSLEKTVALSDVIQLSEEQIKTVGINTTSVEYRTIEKTIRLNGKASIAPSHLISVSSIFGGRVKSIQLLPGNHFSKGQILAVIENEQFVQLQQEYLTTKAKLEMAQLDFERQKELNTNKASSDKTFQSAQAEYKVLETAKKALEEKLKLININPFSLTTENIRGFINITAPCNGTVSKILSNAGRYLSSSDVIMEIIDNQGLLLHLKAFESDIPSLQTGQNILVYTNQNPENKLTAKIISVVPNIQDDGSTDVIATLDKPSDEIIPGLYINSDITLKDYQTVVLPEQSVVSFENTSYIFEDIGNNTFKLFSINTGISHNGFTEIIDGENLKSKKIVSKGAYDLLMALKNLIEE